MRELLINKLCLDETGKFENDQEYFYGIGQGCKELIKKVKFNDNIKNQLFNKILTSQNPKELHKRFITLWKSNNQYIIESKKINNLLAMIISYRVETEINKDLIINGYLDNSVI